MRRASRPRPPACGEMAELEDALWAGVADAHSGEYRVTEGRLQYTKRPPAVRGLNDYIADAIEIALFIPDNVLDELIETARRQREERIASGKLPGALAYLRRQCSDGTR